MSTTDYINKIIQHFTTIHLRTLIAAPRILVVTASSSDVVAVTAAPLDEDGDGLFEGIQSMLVGIRLPVDT